MNEITKYQNKLNTVNFTGFGKIDSNLFFAICTKARNQGTKPVKMSFKEIRSLAGYKEHGNEALISAIEQTYKKMMNLNLRMGDDVNFSVFSLFHRFDVFGEDQYVEVRATAELNELLNDWTDGKWTAFKLEEFIGLKSTYSKYMYRLLKQWRTVGGHTWKVSELRELLEIPDTYEMKEISRKVLKPIEIELLPYFKGLKIEKIKTGRKITAIKFSFQAEDRNYCEITEQEDMKTKQEKIDNLHEQIKKDQLAGDRQKQIEHTSLLDQIQIEKDWMDKKGIPDLPKKSLFSRFFKSNHKQK